MKQFVSFAFNLLKNTGKFFFQPVSFFLFLVVFSCASFAFAEDTFSVKNVFQDSDSDGLSNEEERLYGTDPIQKDTDGDGYADGTEVRGGYDPLKKAPGDRLIVQSTSNENRVQNEEENLTEKVSLGVADLVKNADEAEISLEDIDSVLESAIGGGEEEVVLPEITEDEIKIKKLSKKEKKLSGDERTEKEKEYVVEYLTEMAYIFVNNSPSAFKTESELESIATTITNQSIGALSLGGFSSIEDLAKNGERMLAQIKEVEVPEPMLETHMKALRMAKYAVVLKDEMKALEEDPAGDPLKNIATLSKVQGFLNVVVIFVGDLQSQLAKYEISNIPIEL